MITGDQLGFGLGNIKRNAIALGGGGNSIDQKRQKQMGLEAYDRLIQNPMADPEMVTKEFLLKNYKQSQRDPEKFIKQQTPASSNNPLALAQQVAQNGGQPLPGGKPGVQPANQPTPAQAAGGLPKI